MKLDLVNNLINIAKKDCTIQNFIKELSNFFENNNGTKNTEIVQEYSNYWKYKNFIEDEVSATIGLSRWATVVTYDDDLSKAINDSALEISKKEGTLYRKQFKANGPTNNSYFWINKYEKGEIEHLRIAGNIIPKELKDKDIIFQYKKDGSIKVRLDLKDKVIKLASEKCEKLKQKENEKAKEFKKEGHIYDVFEDDGYIFLKDSTEKNGKTIEDIDFVINCFKGEGQYQVINGEYKLIYKKSK